MCGVRARLTKMAGKPHSARRATQQLDHASFLSDGVAEFDTHFLP